MSSDWSVPISSNPIAHAISSRGLAVGAMLYEFDTPRVMRLLAAAGVDFAIVDLEHTSWDAYSLRRLLATGRDAHVYAIARVLRAEYGAVASALDAGASGVMAPMVESAEQARALVAAARYPPTGRRGFGILLSDELPDGPAAAAERANRETTVIAQVETAAGIDHAEGIVAVPGVDIVWLGQFDLSLSLGVAGDFEHPTYRAAVDHLIETCRRAQKPLGQMIASTAEGIALRERGLQLLAYADVWLFENALRGELDAVRDGM